MRPKFGRFLTKYLRPNYASLSPSIEASNFGSWAAGVDAITSAIASYLAQLPRWVNTYLEVSLVSTHVGGFR